MLYKVLVAFILSSLLAVSPSLSQSKSVTVGSKKFTENYIVAEIFSQLLEEQGYQVTRKFGMGGTMVAYSALKNHEIDIYPEYTGTLAIAVLKLGNSQFENLNQHLQSEGLKMLRPLGFDNSYCAIMRKQQAQELNIESISDLKNYPKLVAAFSFEFQEREDGWPALKQVYQLKNPVKGLEVPLTYQALKNKRVDVAEAYSTEPLIEKYQFKVLKDDKNFFPKYSAVALVHSDIDSDIKSHLDRLSGLLDNQTITRLNAQAIEGTPIAEVASGFLHSKNLIRSSSIKKVARGIQWMRLWQQTQTHIYLTCLAVFLATLIAVPLATFIVPYKRASKFILGLTGILQTIPSIALLTFMIPFFGIGFTPAIVGLFIYSLLPILQNTYIAMSTVDPRIVTAARGIGLYPIEVLLSVKLPLAFPTILAGIRTATILNIGTATLAAFIGAGGLGEPIVTGLALNDNSMVLQGAIPAALLAILMDGLFSLINKAFVKNI